MRSSIALLSVLLASLAPAVGGPAEFFVALTGRDTNAGTRQQPFASLEAARDAIRELKATSGLPDGGATVWIRGGVYQRAASFVLTSEDSGSQTATIVYRARDGERVTLSGGVRLDGALFVPLADPRIAERLISEQARRHVRQLALRAVGVSAFDPIPPRGFPHPIRPAPLELFLDGKPLTLARWPNAGFTRTGKVIDPGSRPRRGEQPPRRPVFLYEGQRPSRWLRAEDIWLFGYWFHDWADEAIRVRSIDPEKRQITLATPHTYGVAAGKPYYAENLLEELDRPGEYYVDRATGMLYLWPPQPLDQATLVLSTLAEPLITLRDVSHVTFRGLTLELSRGDGLVIEGGSNVRVAGCTLRNLGNRAVVVEGGSRHGVISCDVYQTGEGGLVLTGGDRPTLTPAGHYAVNNHIHDYSRRGATYRAAVSLRGVGCRAAHNLIHDAPHSAVFFWGNDHLIEFNEIHDVLRRTGDGGAVYTGRDWTFRGNVIRYNFFHDLNGIGKWENAVYIDDQASGVTVSGNVFHNCHWGMLVGGGRDNVIENNVFSNCRLAIHLDARGLGWAKDALSGVLGERLAAMPYQREPWASRYPRLVGILKDQPLVPKGNVIRRNVLYRSGALDADLNPVARRCGTIADNWETDADPGFIDAQHLRFALRADSAVFREIPDFVPIPFEKIGLYKDEYRTTLPAQTRISHTAENAGSAER